MSPNDDEASDEAVLDPEELSLDRECVTAIDDDRYLIESGGETVPLADSAWSTDAAPEGAEPRSAAAVLHDTDARHGIVVSAKTDGVVDCTQLASDDIREVFDELLYWYASQLDADAPAEEVIRTMLRSSGFDDV